MNEFDLLIVGAGPVGCTIAEHASRTLGLKSIIIDKRSHVAGNCYDDYHSSGILIHKYGPHYFRAKNQDTFKYLSKFTKWIDGNYVVKSSIKNQLFSFPINLNTLEDFYKIKLSKKSAKELIEKKIINYDTPNNSEEFVLSRVGKQLYESFYKNYTIKQWGMDPSELHPSVCGRIPIRFNRNDSYVDEGIQKMPINGYTKLFQKMIDNKNITLMLNTDYNEIKNILQPKYSIFYTGAIDEFFEYKFGKLGWRSLNFEFIEKNIEYYQNYVQINYPNDHDYTRCVEIKHVTKQIHPKTVLSYEYPTSIGEPFYPIKNLDNDNKFSVYKEEADNLEKAGSIFFVGRLANYKYINIDQAIELAIDKFYKFYKHFNFTDGHKNQN